LLRLYHTILQCRLRLCVSAERHHAEQQRTARGNVCLVFLCSSAALREIVVRQLSRLSGGTMRPNAARLPHSPGRCRLPRTQPNAV